MQLLKNLHYVGVQDFDLRVFDIIMETKYGTSYNSYLLETNEGCVLFETAKVTFFDEYLKNITAITPLENIKYIICSHTEPDHVGSLEKLLSLNPNITVISSMIAKNYLSEIVNKDFHSKTVKDLEQLQIGQYHFKFLSCPNLHWPDTIYTYIEELKTLITCDSFGAHYATHDVLLSKVKDTKNYEDAFEYYTKMILSPFKPFLLKAMNKLEGIDIQLICPGHGPVLDTNINETISWYKNYATPIIKGEPKVAICYVSCYGYTEMLALEIQSIMKENNIQCEALDLVTNSMDHVVTKLKQADAILYGCPTLLNDALPPIYHAMNEVLSAYDGKKIVSAFGSYGWTGEAVPNMLARLKQQKHTIVDEGYRCKFKPSQKDLNNLKTYTLNFISHLKN